MTERAEVQSDFDRPNKGGRYPDGSQPETSLLLQELRGWKTGPELSDDASRMVWLMHLAADEIDRLRNALQAVADQEKMNGHTAETRMMDMADIARAALNP